MASLERLSSSKGCIASDLKSERERRKVTLAQIAADTHISLRYLQSLEEGRYGDLPGGMYNRAFLRAYCESLDLDHQDILRRYETEISPAVEKPFKAKKKLPQQNSSSRHNPIIAWSLMLLISATGLFFSRRWIAAIFSPYFSHTPVTSVRYESAPQPGASIAAQSSLPANPPAVEPAAPFQESSVLSVISAAANSEQANAATNSASPIRLDIEITQSCWISINTDGKPALRKLLQPGDVQSFGASDQFMIIAGNAGGVRLKINGMPAKPLGKSGEVVKTLINRTNLNDFIDQTTG
jgi:cytoskeletal protein RodZ